MGFKDAITQDIRVFINLDEFAENHVIDGVLLPVIIDNEKLQERSKKEYDGISVGEILFYINTTSLNKKPKIGSPMIFDDKLMYVFDCREDMGMYEIILQQNRSE